MKAALVPYRLRPQRLVGAPLATPADVVSHLGAVQSQDRAMSSWSIGRRCGAALAEVEESFARADVVRTHVLRPTWHHVLATDLPDLLAVTAPRVERLIAAGNRAINLSEERVRAGADVVAEAVAADGPLTRAEVAARLDAAGFEHTGLALAHMVMTAEIAGQIVSGPIRGKQHTYARADLPDSTRTPDERLAWIARTYARGHGPFRARDLAWWTSLTLTSARAAIALAELRPFELDGEDYVTDEEQEPVEVPPALLLSNFDELISYARDPEDLARLGGDTDAFLRAGGLLFLAGRLSGSWRRSLKASEVSITIRSAVPLAASLRRAIEAEAEAFGRFCDRTPAVSFDD